MVIIKKPKIINFKSIKHGYNKAIKSSMESVSDVLHYDTKTVINLFCKILNRKQISIMQNKGMLGRIIKVIIKNKKGGVVSFCDLEKDTIYNINADIVEDDIGVGDVFIEPIMN